VPASSRVPRRHRPAVACIHASLPIAGDRKELDELTTVKSTVIAVTAIAYRQKNSNDSLPSSIYRARSVLLRIRAVDFRRLFMTLRFRSSGIKRNDEASEIATFGPFSFAWSTRS